MTPPPLPRGSVPMAPRRSRHPREPRDREGLDRLRKGRLCARAGIADYWIVNLIDEVLEVYRDPVRAPSEECGFKYGSARRLGRHALVTPLAAPRARVRVAALLP